MMAVVDLIVDLLGVRMAMEGDFKKRLKLFMVILAIGFVVVIFDPF